MERIMIMSSESGNHKHLVALIEAVFPECCVEVVSEAEEVGDATAAEHREAKPFVEKDLSQNE